ncbi:MAG: 40S ribosomal protein S19 [Candidatus Micrarchaeota archaeon]
MMKYLTVDAGKLNNALAVELKKIPEIKQPVWALMVKSGSHNERVPQDNDFWFKRCGALLRTLSLAGETVGVQRLRHKFGGRTQHTVARSHHRKAGGKGIRLALQQLEKAGLVKKEKFGRSITAAGRKLLDKAAKTVAG